MKTRKYDMKGVILMVMHQVCSVKIAEIIHQRKNIEIEIEVRLPLITLSN